ncbi:MAG TPA: hypothetical protein V6C65_34545 [Allocoleopsis sp.]
MRILSISPMRQTVTHSADRPSDDERQKTTQRLARYGQSLEAKKKPISLEQFRELQASVKPVEASTAAAIEPAKPALHPVLQEILDRINSPQFRDAQNLKELQAIHDQSALYPLVRLRDIVLSMGIQLFVANEIPTDLRQRLGMPLDTAAAADVSRRWIIVDTEALGKGCADLNVHPNSALAAAILHEWGHIQLGHGDSENLSQLDRLNREGMAWGYAELMLSQYSLYGYIKDWQLRTMARFAINSHMAA